MARTSTPLSCLTLYCLYLATAFAEQLECASSTAREASWAAAEAEETQGLELLQLQSKKINVTKGSEDGWQCHTYENGQSDEWCASAGIQEGYEYIFNGGQTGLCGDCWCCKRTIPEREPGVVIMNDVDGPAWQCHEYIEQQDNVWCIEQASKKKIREDYEYSWTGGKVELRGCGDCWCCKRDAGWRWETEGVLMTRKETSLLSDHFTRKAILKETQETSIHAVKSGEWQCHDYINGQDDNWCKSVGFEEGIEYSFKSDQCGDCWCCKRSAEVQEEKPAAPLLVQQAAEAQWQCFDYQEEQDNDWCITMANRNLAKFEFAYTGGQVDLCGDCWCCRRTKFSALSLLQLESGLNAASDTAAAVALANKDDGEASSKEKQLVNGDWQCHNYEGEQNDDWCTSAGKQGGFEYAFQSGQCGDCWCCKRNLFEESEPSTGVLAEQSVAEWQCHSYDKEDQNDDWCISMANQDLNASYDFAYTGGQVDLCGDCWCCRRSKEAKMNKDENKADVKMMEKADEKADAPWQCYHYDEEDKNQNNDWCASTKQFGGYELAYTAGEKDLCGECWCCKRELA